jgi:hypothetical protein
MGSIEPALEPYLDWLSGSRRFAFSGPPV